MFDEFVEHAAPTGNIHSSSSATQLQYEGFEPATYIDAQLEQLSVQDNAQISRLSAQVPVFDLGRVQYTLPAPLVSLAVSSDVLAMGLSSSDIVLLVLIELSHAEKVYKISIPRSPAEFTLHKIFLDPSGKHLIVTSTQGENWYLYRQWKKPKQLKSFQRMVIESIAWNKAMLLSSSHSMSTREFLIGTRDGALFEAVLDAAEDFFKSQERHLQLLYRLPEKHPITGVRFEFIPPNDPRNAVVIVTTPSRIYQFKGTPERRSEEGGRVFSAIFASYQNTLPKFLELPSNLTHSELHFYTPNSDQALSVPKGMAWMTGPGIYHGAMNYDPSTDDYVDSASLLPYPSITSSNTVGSPATPALAQPPFSISLTEFHFILLYADKIVAVCNLNEKQTWQDVLPLKTNEVVRGLAADPTRKTYWVYTSQSIFELVVSNESRDVWLIYLEQGKYEIALKYAKTAAQRDKVLAAQAHAFFDEGRYFKAAHCYSQCSVSFEEVALKFLDAGERDALRSYLTSRLERTRKTDITQRMMLATWLVEFFLSKCNELDDLIASESISSDVDNLQTERTIVEGDLRQFFETYKFDLDRTTIYELIQGHGRTDMYLFYATTVGDHVRVIEHWIIEEEWTKAIDAINRQSDVEMYYRFGPVLMRHAPKETVDSWRRQTLLDPLQLVPALLQQRVAAADPLLPNQAIRYLNHVVFEQQNTSPIIHNLLVTFYASRSASADDSDALLLKFLTSAPCEPISRKPYYDLDYALRLCQQTGKIQACVHIYSKMGLWENSVDLALEKGDLELAKINADMPEDDIPLRKKLWLKIARYVVQDKQDIKSAMQFLDDTDILKIEDILPFFPDFVVIDDFKEEIAHALEGYSAHIEELKKEMNEATQTAESIKQDIADLKNRFVTIDATETCSSCSQLLLTRQFYVFPCQHTFHADCLISLAKEYLPSHALRRIVALQTELLKTTQGGTLDRSAVAVAGGFNGRQNGPQRTLLSSNFGNPLQSGTRAANLLGRNLLSAGDKLRDLIVPDALASLVSSPGWIPGMGFSGGKKSSSERDAEQKTEKLKGELEDLLAGSCPLCESVVAGLDKPFVETREMDTSWSV